MDPLSFSGFPDQETSEPVGEDLSSGFLKGVDEADRAIVEKYIKDWDGQVTQRFQSIHKQYEPYKNLGMDPETLRNAAYIYSRLDTDPVEMYKQIHRALKESGMWEDPDEQQEPQGRQDSLPEYEGIPKEFLDDFRSTKAELEELRESMGGFMSHQQEQQESAMLDNILDQMHNVAGDFDEEWILTRLARGSTPQEALDEYGAFVESISSRQRKPPPNVFSGGSVPAGQVDTSKIKTPQDRRAMIAAALEATQQG